MASNLLWAHLLRKDATVDDSSSKILPIAPQDKTGTSMRMLIHDTQANLEKFSTRLDNLLQRVDDCRTQVVNANNLLDVERDKVLSEILEIAHRCQSELKAHVGTPAQASALDLVHVSHVSTEKSVQALEKRIDALQALFQTHVHALQSIQDQQNTLIGAVLPLVPVLHGVSPQLDHFKAALSDVVANAVSTMTNNIENLRSTLACELAHTHRREQSLTHVGSSCRLMSSSRRQRSDISVHHPREPNVPLSSPLDSRSHGGPHANRKRPHIEETTHLARYDVLSRKLSRLGIPPTNLGDPPRLLQTPQTPRQPLADLFLLPGSNASRNECNTASHMNPIFRGNMRPRKTFRAAGDPSIDSSPVPRPPLQPLQHVSADLMITEQHRAELRDLSSNADKCTNDLSGAAPSDQGTLSKAIKAEEILVPPNLTGVTSIHSSPLSSPPSSLHPPGCDLYGTTLNTAQPSRSQNDVSDAPQVDFAQAPPPSSDPFSSNPDASPPKSMSLRDRRAQISRFGRTETRRFIPLVPWSDEEE